MQIINEVVRKESSRLRGADIFSLANCLKDIGDMNSLKLMI